MAMTSASLVNDPVDVKFLDAVVSDNRARWLMFVQREKYRVVVDEGFQFRGMESWEDIRGIRHLYSIRG